MQKAINKVLALIPLLLVATLPQSSQSKPQNKLDDPIKLDTELVVSTVQVINRKTGKAVAGLTRDDFILYEDGVKQHITHFSQDQLPLSIAILLDITGSTIRSQIWSRGLQSLEALKPEDEVAILAFGTQAALFQSFTRDKKLAAKTVTGIFTKAPGLRGTYLSEEVPGDGTHISDPIYETADYFLKAANPDGRRILIVVTDNQPFESWIRWSREEVIHKLYECGVLVYGIRTESGLDRFSNWLASKWSNKGGKVDVYADATGGMVIDGRKGRFEAKLSELIHLLRGSYSLGYVSSNQKRDGRFRKIKLELSPDIEKREGKVVIISRKGYYARKI